MVVSKSKCVCITVCISLIRLNDLIFRTYVKTVTAEMCLGETECGNEVMYLKTSLTKRLKVYVL